MKSLQTRVRSMCLMVRNEEGATMVEYALMIALIAVVVIAGATLLGDSVNAKFGTVATNVGTAS
jgi:pilus assembly protein Flp/PilA